MRGTGKIKVRLSSQYCERGTNEIRAASGRISSFELARNSSRLYLVGGKRPPGRKGNTTNRCGLLKLFPFFFFLSLFFPRGIPKVLIRFRAKFWNFDQFKICLKDIIFYSFIYLFNLFWIYSENIMEEREGLIRKIYYKMK